MLEGKLYIVGVGPGHHDHMTYRAKQVIEESDTIVGYETYVNIVQDLIEGKDVYRYAMTQEVERAHQCIDLAKSGKIVSLVSSGDPGIYGMAGLIYEMLAEADWDPKNGMPVEIIPGISALNSCASIIGSPLMTDFAVLSMSDLLVPWEIIVKRVEAAAQGDFVIVIYNPSSKKRIHQLQDTVKILLKYRKPTTPVAIIKGAFRDSQTVVILLAWMKAAQEILPFTTLLMTPLYLLWKIPLYFNFFRKPQTNWNKTKRDTAIGKRDT